MDLFVDFRLQIGAQSRSKSEIIYYMLGVVPCFAWAPFGADRATSVGICRGGGLFWRFLLPLMGFMYSGTASFVALLSHDVPDSS